jgi:antirestriction protein ArdC
MGFWRESLPPPKESYYSTALHELTHWTKQDSRLQRDFSAKRFGDSGYAREELVAELGAAFLCAELGITPDIREDHAAYLGHWLKVLKEDKRAIFGAAAHAQRAADYLNTLQPRHWAAGGRRGKRGGVTPSALGGVEVRFFGASPRPRFPLKSNRTPSIFP